MHNKVALCKEHQGTEKPQPGCIYVETPNHMDPHYYICTYHAGARFVFVNLATGGHRDSAMTVVPDGIKRAPAGTCVTITQS